MFIYQIYCKTTKKSYIGQCIYEEFNHRYAFNEWWADRSNREVSRDCKRYGKEDFIIKMLIENICDRKFLDRLEEYFCRTFNAYSPNGYNVEICCADIGDINELENYILQYSKPRILTFQETTIKDLPNEIWKDVVNHEGLYVVSNLGRVKGLDRMEHRKTYSRRRKGQLMHQHIDSWGYLRTTLCKNGKTWSHHVHKLVAMAFHENPNNYLQVNHKNGIKTDARAENLEWCDQYFNMQHAVRTGLRKTGEENWKAKLSLEQVKKIRKLCNPKLLTYIKIAEMFNVHPSTIRSIANGRNWKHY